MMKYMVGYIVWDADAPLHCCLVTVNVTEYTHAPGRAASGSLWGRSCEQRRWGCRSRPPSAAGLCRPVQLGQPALVSCAALRPTASIQTTPAGGFDKTTSKSHFGVPCCSEPKNQQACVTLAWRVRDQCQSARSVCSASLRLRCSCGQEGIQSQLSEGQITWTESNRRFQSDRLRSVLSAFTSLPLAEMIHFKGLVQPFIILYFYIAVLQVRNAFEIIRIKIKNGVPVCQ